MWQKNALFVGLCLVGLAWLTTSILRRDRIEPPQRAQTDRPGSAQDGAAGEGMVRGDAEAMG